MRQISSVINEQFQLLLVQEEAKQRYQQSQLEQKQQQQVKPKMLKRMSASEKNDKPSRATSRKASQHTEQSEISASRQMSLQSASLDVQTTTEPFTTAHDDDSAPNPNAEQLLDEIGKQFMSIAKEPSHRRTAAQVHGPKVKRLSSGIQEPVGNRDHVAHLKQSPRRFDSEESVWEMMTPLRLSHIEKHDGNVVAQQLESTEGVRVHDDFDLFVTKSKTRMSILDFPPTEPAPDEPYILSEAMPRPATGFQNIPMDTSSTEQESPQHSIFRTSLILDSMEEGEVETRIDGDGKATVLVQSFMGEKETAIVSKDGHTMLLPASELSKYEQENMMLQAPMDPMQDETSQTQTPSIPDDSVQPPSPSSLSPPAATPVPPPPPPPEPEPQVREPWPG